MKTFFRGVNYSWTLSTCRSTIWASTSEFQYHYTLWNHPRIFSWNYLDILWFFFDSSMKCWKSILHSKRLSKPMWHGHFASNITSVSIMMHRLHTSRLMHKKISLHPGYPHYVWWLKMDLVAMKFVTKFSISMSLN